MVTQEKNHSNISSGSFCQMQSRTTEIVVVIGRLMGSVCSCKGHVIWLVAKTDSGIC
jgi:hypothetical protein